MTSNELDKYKVLDTVNQWIFNCDTKASIVLATLGIFLTILFSSSIGNFIAGTIKNCTENITVCNVIYLIIFIVGIIFMCAGIYKLIRVLVPTINMNHSSVMFFGNVAAYPTFDEYCKSVSTCSSDDFTADILHQIFAASRICAQKFKNQKMGIMLSFIGVAIVLFWLLLGFVVYYL